MQSGAASTASELYSPPAVRTPSLQQLAQSAAKFNLDIDEAELKQYQDVIKEALVSYDRVDKMAEPIPAVKWPRTPGWRPEPKDNPHNAWYWRTEITGASTGKLHGKTVAIKDNVAVAGGSIKGKSACEDLCLSGDSFTSVTGPVLNAHDRTRSAGGSSSGSATLLTGDLNGIRVGLLKEGFGTSHIYNVINEGCLETMIKGNEICRMALNFGQMSNVCPFNLTGHPALSINAGFSQGLPVGMMIVGRHFDDATVLKVAHAFENIRDAKI
uniref:Amidase domain-containing protein n=1 Tax=Branchiostoma floridae TaxID=7739 RepID=C3YPB8_BRAFL|eukprot:XP_002601690.1 hypothetical protein BRAFLDRAFT_94570 [Branchiostoma floridae]